MTLFRSLFTSKGRGVQGAPKCTLGVYIVSIQILFLTVISKEYIENPWRENMFTDSDLNRNACMLTGKFGRQGYDWWWHSFTGVNEKTGEEKSFFIEFFLCNPALAQKDPVLGQLEKNKEDGKRPSYLCVKAGCWGENAKQIHRFFGWNDVKLHASAPTKIKAGNCFLSERRLHGYVCVSEEEAEQHPEYMCQSGEMKFDLKVEKKIPFNVGYGAGKLFRFLQAFEMYWHAEGMKTLYEGVVFLDGEKYIVKKETSYGYADKNWGADFTSPWVWLSSNHVVSNLTGKQLHNTVFDIGGGKPKVFGIELKNKLLGAIYYENKGYEFNFSKFWTGSKTRFECRETQDQIIWHVVQDTWKMKMITDVTCQKKDMLWIQYEEPTGRKRHNRLWNGGTGVGRVQLIEKHFGNLKVIDDLSISHVGCEYGEMDL